VQKEPAAVSMGVLIKMIDTAGVVRGSTALDAVDFITFFQQQLCQIGTVLPANTGDKSFFHLFFSLKSLPSEKLSATKSIQATSGASLKNTDWKQTGCTRLYNISPLPPFFKLPLCFPAVLR
jgi:hypothetical protein